MKRRTFLQLTTAAGAALPALTVTGCANPPAGDAAATGSVTPFELDEAGVDQLREAMESGRLTARAITEKYLNRIAEIDQAGPTLKSVIEVNPEALSIAGELDRERQAGNVRGPLHGIPVLIKDNIDTADKMMTTAGALALEGNIARQDSWVAERLRAAGAVILGKTNLSEWANFRSSRSSSGWSGRGGQTRNPCVLDRNPCGSSSGSGAAVAANLCALAVGTETNGSIIAPASLCGIVGVKPTVGLWGRSGIIPISHTQDTAGPMTRSVRDAALLLGAVTGVDPRDPVTQNSRGKSHTDYTTFLDADGLQGARIGVHRGAMGFHEGVDRLMEAAMALLRERGAALIDLDSIAGEGMKDEDEFTVLLYEFKNGVNTYLAGMPDNVKVRTLDDVIAFNEANADRSMPYFGQEILRQAAEKGDLDSPEYRQALSNILRASREDGLDRVMDEQQLDAIIAPSDGPAWTTDLVNGDRYISGGNGYGIPAIAGYPNVSVPMGYVHGLPVGLSFFGRAYAEPTLLKLAFAYEQASKHRQAPTFRATLEG